MSHFGFTLLITVITIIEIKSIYKTIKYYKENPESLKGNLFILLLITIICGIILYISIRMSK